MDDELDNAAEAGLNRRQQHAQLTVMKQAASGQTDQTQHARRGG